MKRFFSLFLSIALAVGLVTPAAAVDTYTSSCRIVQMATGSNDTLWGVKANAAFAMLDVCATGNTSIAVAGSNITLTTANNAADQARNSLLIFTGTPGTTRTITLPDIKKTTMVDNNTDSSLIFTAGAGTTVTVASGSNAIIYTDGATNVVAQINVSAFAATQLAAANAAAGRTALGLGTAAVQNTGTSGANVPLANGANTWAAAQTFTLAPVFTDAPGTRTALGLGTLATTTPAAGVATFLTTPSSANLAAALTDKSGSGPALFQTSASIIGPSITGASLSTSSVNGVTLAGSASTLTIGNSKTPAISNTLTFTGTDGSSIAFGAGGTIAAIAYSGSGTDIASGTVADARLASALTGKTYNGLTINTTTGTLALTNAKTLTVSNSMTLTASDGSTLAIGGGGTLGSNAYTSTAYAPLASPTFSGTAAFAGITANSVVFNGVGAGSLNPFSVTGQTTGHILFDFQNTGGRTWFGTESSAGGTIATGGSAYATLFGSVGATRVQLFTGDQVYVTLETNGHLLVGTATDSGVLTVSGTANISGATTIGGAVIHSSTTSFSGAITYGGVTLANSVTGTGSLPLSISPTFTGTLNADVIATTGAISGATFRPTSATPPTDGLYLSGIHQLGVAINNAAAMDFSANALAFNTAGQFIVFKAGSNGAVGTFTCNGATPVSVTNSGIATGDGIVISLKTVGGTVGAVPAIKTITASSGFTVACTAADTSAYNYYVFKQF